MQERQLGTADALRAAESEIADDFLVLPGDNYINAGSIARIKEERNAMLVAEHPNPPSNFGVVVIRNGIVREIVEKPEDAPPTFTVSTGIYSFTPPDVFSYLQTNEIPPDALAAMIASGRRIRAIPADDWQDAVYPPWDLLKLNSRMLRGGQARDRRGGRRIRHPPGHRAYRRRNDRGAEHRHLWSRRHREQLQHRSEHRDHARYEHRRPGGA